MTQVASPLELSLPRPAVGSCACPGLPWVPWGEPWEPAAVTDAPPYVYRLINTLTLSDYYSATYLLLRKRLNANNLGLQNCFEQWGEGGTTAKPKYGAGKLLKRLAEPPASMGGKSATEHGYHCAFRAGVAASFSMGG